MTFAEISGKIKNITEVNMKIISKTNKFSMSNQFKIIKIIVNNAGKAG